ncbi:MAG: lactate racemase domain-containing protein, partial [Oscillospiraceae bacterium]|nr:lactate racemase domain-containing protein [Oscillospiraceae bacterium]
MNTFLIKEDGFVSDESILHALIAVLSQRQLRRVLILPPDITRAHSYGGVVTKMLYDYLVGRDCTVDIMPALGTHVALTPDELDTMYGGIPHNRFIVHDWKNDCEQIGTVPAAYVSELSEGLFNGDIPVEINRRILDPTYDLVLSVGQVVPHEIVGMANYNKNLFVGCGGNAMINASHYLGALYGMERIMGRDHTPLHRLFDYAHSHFLKDIPLLFVLTVTTPGRDGVNVECVSIGDDRATFEKAVAVSQEKNIIYIDKPVRKAVVHLDPVEFKRTWLGNKAIYRTRMCIEDGGELLIMAPGLISCGEDPENDRLLKKYGYVTRDEIRALAASNEDLADNLSVAAHIIHSSPEKRFRVTYAPIHMTKDQIESINYGYMPYDKAAALYPPDQMEPGFNTVNGEEVYFIPNPARGLWA